MLGLVSFIHRFRVEGSKRLVKGLSLVNSVRSIGFIDLLRLPQGSTDLGSRGQHKACRVAPQPNYTQSFFALLTHYPDPPSRLEGIRNPGGRLGRKHILALQ